MLAGILVLLILLIAIWFIISYFFKDIGEFAIKKTKHFRQNGEEEKKNDEI